MTDINKLRKKDIETLRKKLGEQRKELANRKLVHTLGKEKDTSEIAKLRKEVARVKTILNEKELLSE